MNYELIINHYYPAETNAPLRHILLVHSQSVADVAMEVCDNHPELDVDRDFIYVAAMLHDIGIVRTDAKGIHCYGSEPYLCHGVIGADMIREAAGVFGIDAAEAERYARICARHTGTGLTARNIRERNLPLPEMDLVPETIEEQIVCYADKFFSKTHLDRRKTFEKALRSLEKFGEEGVVKFKKWHKMFGK